jgi:hypothetical protein
MVSHITTYPHCVTIILPGCRQLLQLIQQCVESIAPLSGHCVWWPLLSCLLACAATACGTGPSVGAAVTPSLCCVTSVADAAFCQLNFCRLPGSSLQSVLHIARILTPVSTKHCQDPHSSQYYTLPGSSLQSVLHIARILTPFSTTHCPFISDELLPHTGNCMCTSTDDVKCWGAV